MNQEVEAPAFHDNRHMKVVRLSALRTGRLYPIGNIPGSHVSYRLLRSRCRCAAGRIMLMKIVNDIIGNRNRDLLACSVVPQPTACPVLLSIIYDITTLETTSSSFITITGNKSYP